MAGCPYVPRIRPTRSSVARRCLDLIVGGDQTFVAGPDTGPWHSALPAGTRLRGIRFRPGRAPRTLGPPADELRDQRVDLSQLWGRVGRLTTDRLLHQPTDLARVVDASVTGPADPEIDLALTRFAAGAGS